MSIKGLHSVGTGDIIMKMILLCTQMCELREQMTELQAARFEQEARCRKLEAEVVERQADLQRSLLETEQVRELMAKAEKVREML